MAALEEMKKTFSLSSLYFIIYTSSSATELTKAVMYFGVRGERVENELYAIEKALTDVLHASGFSEMNSRPVTAKLLNNPELEAQLAMLELLPYIMADGGSVSVVSANEKTGTVMMKLMGSCSGCPSSLGTLKLGIERRLKELLPWVKNVESDQPPAEPDFGFHLDE